MFHLASGSEHWKGETVPQRSGEKAVGTRMALSICWRTFGESR